MRQFTVIGNPINHSKSPEIHSQFAKQFDIELEYTRTLGGIDDFKKTADGFFNLGFGANITVPFKEDALRYADELSEQAKLAGAVNTLSKKDNIIYGDNTDGIGLVRDIVTNKSTGIANKKVLIIGAGGASRGVILPILKEKPELLIITNRTFEKAEQLSKLFANYGNIKSKQLEDINEEFDVVINATSASLANSKLDISPAIFTKTTLAYDMMYGKSSSFLETAHNNGAKTSDGFGMLIEQAAESFYIWHNKKPDTSKIK